jgi:hypothetical protein
LIADIVGAVATPLPKISVTFTVAVDVPEIFPDAGSDRDTLYAGPATPFRYVVVEAPRIDAVIADAPVLVVNT